MSPRETRIDMTRIRAQRRNGLSPDLGFDLLPRGGAKNWPWIGHRRRIGVPSGKDHRRPDLGDGVEAGGEVWRQVKAAVGVGIARQIADMERDALAGELLHVIGSP
jgi:hypothetical protein